MVTKKAATEKKNDTGRPCKYTQAIGDEICAKLAEGWFLVEICKAAHMPARSTVHGWLLKGQSKSVADNRLTLAADRVLRAEASMFEQKGYDAASLFRALGSGSERRP